MKIVFEIQNGTSCLVEGEPGMTLLDIALANNIPGILGDCGGELSCGTCHVYIDQESLAELPEPSPDERIMIEDGVIDPRENSRLCCQIRVADRVNGMTVSIPSAF